MRLRIKVIVFKGTSGRQKFGYLSFMNKIKQRFEYYSFEIRSKKSGWNFGNFEAGYHFSLWVPFCFELHSDHRPSLAIIKKMSPKSGFWGCQSVKVYIRMGNEFQEPDEKTCHGIFFLRHGDKKDFCQMTSFKSAQKRQEMTGKWLFSDVWGDNCSIELMYFSLRNIS